MGRKTWIKIFCDKWLTGSIREELPEIRAVWVDILTLAGDMTYGNTGKIQIAKDTGLSDDQICAILQMKKDLWLQAKQRLQDTERITVIDNNVIQIVNWQKYQSDYMRQRPHREPAFKKLRETIKERDGYTCQICMLDEENLKVPLCIHHIDNDPSNNEPKNLITLCMSCHSHLYKKAVHPTKTQERLAQEEEFKRKVQQKGLAQKKKREVEVKEEVEVRSKKKEKALKDISLKSWLDKFIEYVKTETLPDTFKPSDKPYDAYVYFCRGYLKAYSQLPDIKEGKGLQTIKILLKLYKELLPQKVDRFFEDSYRIIWKGEIVIKTLEVFKVEAQKIKVQQKSATSASQIKCIRCIYHSFSGTGCTHPLQDTDEWSDMSREQCFKAKQEEADEITQGRA